MDCTVVFDGDGTGSGIGAPIHLNRDQGNSKGLTLCPGGTLSFPGRSGVIKSVPRSCHRHLDCEPKGPALKNQALQIVCPFYRMVLELQPGHRPDVV